MRIPVFGTVGRGSSPGHTGWRCSAMKCSAMIVAVSGAESGSGRRAFLIPARRRNPTTIWRWSGGERVRVELTNAWR